MTGARVSVATIPVIVGAVPDETRPHCTRFVACGLAASYEVAPLATIDYYDDPEAPMQAVDRRLERLASRLTEQRRSTEISTAA